MAKNPRPSGSKPVKAGQTPVNKVKPGGGKRGATPIPRVVPPKKKS